MQPFGQGNKKPLFGVRGVTMRNRAKVGGQGNHLRFVATDGVSSVAAIMFRAPQIDRAVDCEGAVDLVFEPVSETWQGRTKPKLMVKDIAYRDAPHPTTGPTASRTSSSRAPARSSRATSTPPSPRPSASRPGRGRELRREAGRDGGPRRGRRTHPRARARQRGRHQRHRREALRRPSPGLPAPPDRGGARAAHGCGRHVYRERARGDGGAGAKPRGVNISVERTCAPAERGGRRGDGRRRPAPTWRPSVPTS